MRSTVEQTVNAIQCQNKTKNKRSGCYQCRTRISKQSLKIVGFRRLNLDGNFMLFHSECKLNNKVCSNMLTFLLTRCIFAVKTQINKQITNKTIPTIEISGAKLRYVQIPRARLCMSARATPYACVPFMTSG